MSDFEDTGAPGEDPGRWGAWWHILELVLQWIGAVALATASITTLLAVVVRYFGVLGGALPWSMELATLCMIWMVAAGGVIAFRRRQHVSFGVANVLPTSVAPAMRILQNILLLVFASVVVIPGVELIQRTLDQTTPSLGLSQAHFYLPLLVLAALLALGVASESVTAVLRRRHRNETGESGATDAASEGGP